jgi:signal transduction histidine kinase
VFLSKEADLAWGEVTAQEVFISKETQVREEKIGSLEDRTNYRLSLGLPLKIRDQILGVLVFMRFGGPGFEEEQIYLAELIALPVAQLLERHRLVDQIANLEAVRRLDSLQDDFIATISHELLTPLGFIKGYATTLLREDIQWDEQTRREFLTIIEEESDRLRELIDNMMDSSRLQAGTLRMTFQTTRLDTLLREIALRARSRFDNLAVELDIQSPGLLTRADPTRLAQVFDNIISNATKYAPGSPITISLKKEKNQACIIIHDDGPGIRPEYLPNIFKRFYRTPDHSAGVRGTGLGLYICRKIIQGHGGEIEAQSEPGQGTSFIITLPINKTN